MTAYYNEIDPYCVEWLRNLIREGLIPDGDVDGRDIREVDASDLLPFTQCHFFAGLGGWPYALRLAGWPDDRPVWTGSCPCQSFSNAGKRAGVSDKDRHLWPALSALIRERKPPIFFGEQVKSAIGYGWLDAVASDLEAQAYAFGAAVLPACAVGAPHRRDRIWFVAHARGEQYEGSCASHQGPSTKELPVAHAGQPRLSLRQGQDSGREGQNGRTAAIGSGWWESEPDVGRVAHGIPARMGKLRALGNAIVPPVAAEFIKAVVC